MSEQQVITANLGSLSRLVIGTVFSALLVARISPLTDGYKATVTAMLYPTLAVIGAVVLVETAAHFGWIRSRWPLPLTHVGAILTIAVIVSLTFSNLDAVDACKGDRLAKLDDATKRQNTARFQLNQCKAAYEAKGIFATGKLEAVCAAPQRSLNIAARDIRLVTESICETGTLQPATNAPPK